MSAYNFVEQCRKDAGWPALFRDCPGKKPGQQVWSVTQDDVAAFVGAVRNRSADLIAEMQAKDDLLARCADEKARLVKELSSLGIKTALNDATERVTARAESLGLDDDQTRQIAKSVKP